MSSNRIHKIVRLNQIADALGISVDQLISTDFKSDEASVACEGVSLLFAIQTENGRKRALDFLRRIVDDERR